MKKLIFILIVFASCNGGANKNELMTSLINKQKNLNDSLDSYNKIDTTAKQIIELYIEKGFGVDSSLAFENAKIRMDLIPKIASLEEELKAVNFSIDSLSKMK